MFHQHIAAFIIYVVLLCRVHVLNVLFIVHKRWNSPDEIFAGVEDVQHRLTFLVKSESVMVLHLARYARIIALAPVNEVGGTCHHSRYALAPRFFENRGVCNAAYLSAFKIGVLGFNPLNLCRYSRGVELYAGVGSARIPIVLCNAIDNTVTVHSIPAHRKRLAVAKVKAPIYRPP